MRTSIITAATALCALALTGLASTVAGAGRTGASLPAEPPAVSTAVADRACPVASWPYAGGTCAAGAADLAIRSERRVRVIALDVTPAGPVRR